MFQSSGKSVGSGFEPYMGKILPEKKPYTGFQINLGTNLSRRKKLLRIRHFFLFSAVSGSEILVIRKILYALIYTFGFFITFFLLA